MTQLTALRFEGVHLFDVDCQSAHQMEERFFEWQQRTVNALHGLFWSEEVAEWFRSGTMWMVGDDQGTRATRDDRLKILDQVISRVSLFPLEPPPTNSQFEYDVCLSFASEQRQYVEAVVHSLTRQNVRTFYDKDEQVALWGKNLYDYLSEIYRDKARFCVIFVSKEYAAKQWTTHERQSAQARAIKENREYILPARFDATELPGLNPTVAYIDLRDTSPDQLADLVVKKLARHEWLRSGVAAPALPPATIAETYAERVTFDNRERWDIIRGCVEFTANDGSANILCRVSEEALEDFFGAESSEAMLPVFRSNRSRFETIAARKIRAREFQEGAVSITTADFANGGAA